MSFTERMAGARAAEIAVLQELKDSKWSAFEFGQALLPEDVRDALKKYYNADRMPSLIRWFPDIIAFRMVKLPPKMQIVCFDVKHDTGETPNYAIEIKALECCEIFEKYFFTPCWFIYPGLLMLTPEMVRENCRPGSPGGGSGTPYVLIAKRHAIKLA